MVESPNFVSAISVDHVTQPETDNLDTGAAQTLHLKDLLSLDNDTDLHKGVLVECIVLWYLASLY